jgi:hypothetical protein
MRISLKMQAEYLKILEKKWQNKHNSDNREVLFVDKNSNDSGIPTETLQSIAVVLWSFRNWIWLVMYVFSVETIWRQTDKQFQTSSDESKGKIFPVLH